MLKMKVTTLPLLPLLLLLLSLHCVHAAAGRISSACLRVTFSRRVGLHYTGGTPWHSAHSASVHACALLCAGSAPCRAANYDTVGELCDLYEVAAERVPRSADLDRSADGQRQPRHAAAAVYSPRRAPAPQIFTRSLGRPPAAVKKARSSPLAAFFAALFGGLGQRRRRGRRSAGAAGDFEPDAHRVYMWQVTCLEWRPAGSLLDGPSRSAAVNATPPSTAAATTVVATIAAESTTAGGSLDSFFAEHCPPHRVQYSVQLGSAPADPELPVPAATVAAHTVSGGEHACAVRCYNAALCTGAGYDAMADTCRLTSAFLSPQNEEAMRRYEAALRAGSSSPLPRVAPAASRRTGRQSDLVIGDVRCYRPQPVVQDAAGAGPSGKARPARPPPAKLNRGRRPPPPFDPDLARNLATGLSALLGAPGATAKSKRAGLVLPKIIEMVSALDGAKPGSPPPAPAHGGDFGVGNDTSVPPQPHEQPQQSHGSDFGVTQPQRHPLADVAPATPATSSPLDPIPTSAPSGRYLSMVNTAGCGEPAVAPSVPRLDEHSVEWGHTRIVGGAEARPHSWPWQAALRYQGVHVCGASVLGRLAVITAAHCVRGGTNASAYTITAGGHDRQASNGANVYPVHKIIVHPRYHRPKRHANDIALVLLAGDGLPLRREGAHVAPICLAQREAEGGAQCVVTGWGLTDDRSPSARLQQAVVPIVPWRVCNDGRHYAGRIDQGSMLCAGYDRGQKDSCQGDSGGPLVCPADSAGRRWHLAGVVSWGYGCGRRYKPGVYANVPMLRHWILDALAGEL